MGVVGVCVCWGGGSEGDTQFLCAMKIVSQENIGLRETEVTMYWKL